MPTTLSPGLKSTRTLTVTPDVTADAVGSGLLPVFSTPSMIAFIELAASELVQPYLDEGVTTVGTEISVKHLSATPVGMTVRAEAELT
ncbi:MAG: thioesterase, partial [Clostridia bacterium]|nr:thioesterase [Clostridia bacterium]